MDNQELYEFNVISEYPEKPDGIWTNYYTTLSPKNAMSMMLDMLAAGRRNVRIEGKKRA
jgi:hypothetical protein